MADITMCWGKGCKLKEKCYRYTAPASPYWQSMFADAPWKTTEGEEYCRHFWENNWENELEQFPKWKGDVE